MFKKIYDVTIPLNNTMPIYPGDPAVEIYPSSRIEKGDWTNLSSISMSTHSGSHLDAPYHFYKEGLTLDKFSLELLVGPAQIIEFEFGRQLTLEMIQQAPIKENTKRLLIKTKNSYLWLKKKFIGKYFFISSEAAQYIVDKGIKLLGFDYLSVDEYGNKEASAHKTLLQNNVLILEGLNLLSVETGEYLLVCLPLKLEGTDGAPARVILLET